VNGLQLPFICAKEDSPIHLSYNTMSPPTILVASMSLCESVRVCVRVRARMSVKTRDQSVEMDHHLIKR